MRISTNLALGAAAMAGFAYALKRAFGVSGPLGTATAANIFVGMVEAPLVIRPYLATMSRGALFATMTAGMASIAGTVLALYATFLEPILPGATAHLIAVIERLRALGADVVVGTCPDLGALRPVPQPLRSLGSRLSRQLADAQAQAAAGAGARVVSLRRAVGPFFVTQPEEMFSLDRFHPSALGYRRTAEALLPEVIAAWRAS